MKRFSVVIPEKREEVVMVEWEIEAENEEAIKEMLENGTFSSEAEYIETNESRWGFEVVETYSEDAEIEEIENGL
jgi:hypothetical protein